MMRAFIRKEIVSLAASFKGATPFRHVLVLNFLEDPKPILKAVSSLDFKRLDTDLFSFSQSGNLLYETPAQLRPLTGFLCSSNFSGFISSITGHKLRPGALDLSASLYTATDYLLCHDDDIEDRKIAYILYLSDSFSQADGGALALLENNGKHPGQKAKRYFPVQNSLMVFEVSKKSWHEIEEVVSSKKRCTIGGWLH